MWGEVRADADEAALKLREDVAGIEEAIAAAEGRGAAARSEMQDRFKASIAGEMSVLDTLRVDAEKAADAAAERVRAAEAAELAALAIRVETAELTAETRSE